MNKKRFTIILAITFIIFNVFTHQSVALAEYKTLEAMPGVGAKGSSPSMSDYINGIYNFAVAAVVFSALLMITIGGFMYMVSAGNQAQAGTAKRIIIDALLGLVVVFTIYLILHTINPDLVSISMNFENMRVDINNTVNRSTISNNSGTSCGLFEGKQVCYATKAICEKKATSCTTSNKFIDDDGYYKLENGKLTRITKKEFETCKKNGGNCYKGDEAKEKTKYTTKTKEEIKTDLKNAGVTTKEGVDVTGMPEITKQAVIDVGGERCANGGCEKQIIHTEGEGTNVVDLADDSGTFFDSNLVNGVQAEAYKVGETKIEKLPGGTTFTNHLRKTTTYTYPEGHKLAGQTVQIVQEGYQTKGTSWLPLTFAPTSSKVVVYGEKNTPPENPTPVEDDDPKS